MPRSRSDHQRDWRASGVLSLAAALAALAGGADPVRAQDTGGRAVVTGEVVTTDGGGLDGVTVRLVGTGWGDRSDDRGRFRIDGIPAGRYALRLDRIGYRAREDTVDLTDGTVLQVRVEMSTEPVELPGFEITSRSLLLEVQGFYERRAQGFRGVFMDRPEIERRDPLYVGDLFRSIPGVELVQGSRLIMSQSVNLRDGGRGCEPALWLDGIRTSLRNYDMIRPDHMEGLEVYTGGGAPGKFNDLCGTVVIWTRMRMRR